MTMAMEIEITDRQMEVARLIAQGLTADEIGVELGISGRTAKAHGDTLRQKLGVARRRQIPAALIERGFATRQELYS